MHYLLVILLILILITIIYFTISFLFSYKELYKINNNIQIQTNSKIIVSLTTLPSRINKIHKVIESILNNTIKPDVIYINIPKFSKKEKKEYIIPDNIKNIERVIINIIDEDYGPVTKIYPTLLKENDPESIIICIDDDKEYDKNLINHLVMSSEKYNNKCICITGWNYINLGFIALPFITHFFKNIVNKVNILQCYNGVLYKRKFFQDDFKDYLKLKKCFTVDDILISKYLKDKNIEILSIPYYFKNIDIDISSNNFKLGSFNLSNNSWIKCINSHVIKDI